MMLRYALLTGTLASPMLAAAAVSTIPDQISVCSAQAAEDKRLACYDGVAKQLQRPPTASPDPTPTVLNHQSGGTRAETKDGAMFGRWRAEVTVDAMNDMRTVSFGNEALPEQSSDADAAKIGLLCSGKSISFVWLSKAYLGQPALPMNNDSLSLDNVSYRADAGKPRSEKWNILNNVAVPANAVPVVQAIADAKRFVIKLTSYDYQSHQAVFNLDGVQDVLGQLSECWPPTPPSTPEPAPASASPKVGSVPAPAHTVKKKSR